MLSSLSRLEAIDLQKLKAATQNQAFYVIGQVNRFFSFLIILEFKSGTRNREVVSHRCKALVILSQRGIPKSCSMGGIDARQVATEVMGTRDMNKCFSKKDTQQTHQKYLALLVIEEM